MNNKVSILSTVSLDPPLIDLAMSNDIMLDAISFIATEPIKDAALQKQLESFQSGFAVFITSPIACTAFALVNATVIC